MSQEDKDLSFYVCVFVLCLAVFAASVAVPAAWYYQSTTTTALKEGYEEEVVGGRVIWVKKRGR